MNREIHEDVLQKFEENPTLLHAFLCPSYVEKKIGKFARPTREQIQHLLSGQEKPFCVDRTAGWLLRNYPGAVEGRLVDPITLWEALCRFGIEIVLRAAAEDMAVL